VEDSVLKDFREFISRGNVIDLAVAVIIGAAFTAIITALVADIITPIIGVFLGGVGFSRKAITVGEATIAYGSFIQAVIDFLIIAFVIFLMVRSISQIQKKYSKQEEEAAAAAEPPEDVKLLKEIRDILQGQNH
jgi:large conductance mechanosensitive channel